jgi:hypothetical protein
VKEKIKIIFRRWKNGYLQELHGSMGKNSDFFRDGRMQNFRTLFRVKLKLNLNTSKAPRSFWALENYLKNLRIILEEKVKRRPQRNPPKEHNKE